RYVPVANPATDGDYDAQITGLTSNSTVPCSVAVDSTGAVYASTVPNGPLTKYPASQFGGAGAGATIDSDSGGVAVDPSNNDVYVAEQGHNDISVFSPSGDPRDTFGGGDVSTPRGVAVDPAGNVFVANSDTGNVSIFAPPSPSTP